MFSKLLVPLIALSILCSSPGIAAKADYLECGILIMNPPRPVDENDPLFKILVSFTFDKKEDLEGLNVIHVSTMGKRFERGAQYTNTRLKATPGKLEVIWSGEWKKDKSSRMEGRVWSDPNDRWFYSEVQTLNGKPTLKLLAGCYEVTMEKK